MRLRPPDPSHLVHAGEEDDTVIIFRPRWCRPWLTSKTLNQNGYTGASVLPWHWTKMEDDGQKGNVAEVLHHPLRVAFETWDEMAGALLSLLTQTCVCITTNCWFTLSNKTFGTRGEKYTETQINRAAGQAGYLYLPDRGQYYIPPAAINIKNGSRQRMDSKFGVTLQLTNSLRPLC